MQIKVQSKKRTCSHAFAFLFVSLLVFLFPLAVHAADFKTTYNIEYYIRTDDPQNLTKTSYTIQLMNLQPNLIIKKYTLIFPRSFNIGSMVAKDDKGGIIPEIVEKERTIEASFTMNDPRPGLNEINTIYLDFLQGNIFRTKGSIWEVLIPTLENKDGDTHSIIVYLPLNEHRKLSLAKPLPDLVTFDKVVWNNYTGKSIYAVFGDQQRYTMSLTYHLTNPNIYKVYTDVAFPPDTLYQKVTVASIIPQPDSVYSDSDGNFMARYNLNPKEEKQIQFKGIAETFTIPRSEYKKFVKKQFEDQQKNLFDVQPFWKLNSETPITSSNVKDHYDYAIKTLTYNFNRVIKGNSRMGATQALLYADQAVCTEYSDLLIASARQRGIYVREVQGFAFANEKELRPVQEDSDILHSWVEYFDTTKNIWVPIDPTWEDTSGLDYFNSFDFNHIVFALHGKSDDYPYPAGSYKSAPGGKDVLIEPTSRFIPQSSKISVGMELLALPESTDRFSVNVSVKNEGNVNVWDVPLSISADNATVYVPDVTVWHLLPGEKKTIAISFKPKTSLFYQDVKFTIKNRGDLLIEQQIKVPTILTSFRGAFVPVALILFGLILLGLLLKTKHDN